MVDKEEASKLLEDIGIQYLSEFTSTDPFNPENTVHGFISRKPDHCYGAIVIDTVNGRPIPQAIYCTPKLKYPFKFSDTSHETRDYYKFNELNSDENYVIVAEKLDGTNVCAYSYRNREGKRFVTYKSRLNPFLRNSKFGNFLDMVIEILNRDAELKAIINTLCFGYLFNVSMELYGSANTHLIQYESTLSLKILFLINSLNDGISVLDDYIYHTGLVNIKKYSCDYDLYENITRKDLIKLYEDYQSSAEASLELDPLTKTYKGLEGYIFYVLDYDTDLFEMYKCKPPTIEDIHFAGDYISEDAIKATIYKVYESNRDDDDLIETIKEFLLEDYPEEVIDKNQDKISRLLYEVNKEIAFKERVDIAYAALPDEIKDQKDLTLILRNINTSFTKDEMRKVYTTLKSKF